MNAPLLALALAASPSLEAAYPHAVLVRGVGGAVVHASGFRARGPGGSPEAAARAFLRLHGASFGIGPGETLEVVRATAPGEVGPVRLRRLVDGLPVLGGDIVVGVDAGGAVFVVNGAEVPPRSGRFGVSEADAVRIATERLGAPHAAAGLPMAGWLRHLGTTRPAWQVDLWAGRPARALRAWVDGETGRTLAVRDLRRDAQGRVYEVSPSEGPGSPCPIETGGSFAGARSLCADTVLVDLAGLGSAGELSGTRVQALDCQGRSALDDAYWWDPIDCAPVPPSSGSVWDLEPDLGGTSTSDGFAAVMAYHHASGQLAFLRELDPASGWMLEDPLLAVTNLWSEGAPFANAYYTPWQTAAGGRMGLVAIGQAAAVDLAYDATVIDHEVTHAGIDRHGGLGAYFGSRGAFLEALAIEEGLADALATTRTGDPLVGAHAARCLSSDTCAPAPELRDLDRHLTCRGTGAPGNDFGSGLGSFDGLDGEVHDDGEVLGSWFWDLRRALAGVPACGGLCNAADLVLWRTIELTAGGSPGFRVFGATAMASAAALFPADPAVRDAVSCTLARRDMAGCDGTVPVHAGEGKASLVGAYLGADQQTFEVVDEAVVRACVAVPAGWGGTMPSRVWLRKGSPVELRSGTLGYDNITGDWDFTASVLTGGCADVRLAGSGTWFLLSYVPDADGTRSAVVWVSPLSGVTAREAAPVPGACSYGEGPAPEVCGNGFDDDGDGASDCDDADCADAPACQPVEPPPPPPARPERGGGCAPGPADGWSLVALAALLLRRPRRDVRA